MKRLGRWLRSNADAVVALVGGALIGLIALLDLQVLGNNPSDKISAAILLVLALLATSVLRDRQASIRASREAGEVRVLRGTAEIRDAHAEARRETEKWYFKGGTGTYLRAVTLPHCMEQVQLAKGSLRLQIEILDPTDARLCAEYAELRSSLSPGPDGTGEAWTGKRARHESYATILATCMYRQRYTFLEVAIGLSSTVSAFRWDMSSSQIILTQEDPGGPALMVDEGKPLYLACQRELELSFKQTRRVPVSLASDVQLSKEPTHDEVRGLFDKLQVSLPHDITNADISDIIRRAVHPRNPYP